MFRFIAVNRGIWPLRTQCRVLEVSSSAYYAWRQRADSGPARYEAVRLKRIRDRHVASGGTYGVSRIRADLADPGHHLATKRVARPMRVAGLCGVHRRTGVITTTAGSGRAAPDREERDFTVAAPHQLWCADATYVATTAGRLYLAVVIHVFSRRVVGWAVADHLHAELMCAALDHLIGQRRLDGAIHHSDQRCQYTSIAFGGLCREVGIHPSTGSAGECFDNALAESFFATLKREWRKRRTLRSKALFQFIEGWYNPRRRHGALGQRSPIEYERRWAQVRTESTPKLERVHSSGLTPTHWLGAGTRNLTGASSTRYT